MTLAVSASELASTVVSGSMLLALPIALLAGFISFASPCVLPLVPGYLGFLSGMSAATIGEKSAEKPSKSKLLLAVGLFILGFSVVFIAFGFLVGTLGSFLMDWSEVISRVLGVLVIIMGLAFMGAIPFLQSQQKIQFKPKAGLWGATLLGVVFGLGWTPCMGPTLIAIYSLALDEGTALRGGLLAFAYCIGLGLPFLLIALGLQSSKKMVSIIRKHKRGFMVFGGITLIILGLALVTGLWGELANKLQGFINNTTTVL